MTTSNIEVVPPSILLVTHYAYIFCFTKIATDALSDALNFNCEMHLDSSKLFTDFEYK